MNSRNHIKIQEFVIFVEENLKINMLKIKKYRKVTNYCSTIHVTCILKYSLATRIPMLFRNGSNYDYHFCQKQVSRKTGKTIYL